MPTREEMRSLGQEIVRSYEERTRGIAQLQAGVKSQLRELDRGHQAMGRQLRADLAPVKPQLRAAVGSQLRELDQAHQAKGRQLRANLAPVKPRLRGAVGSQLRELDQGSRERRAAVGNQLQEYDRAHQSMGRQLRADLAPVKPRLRAAVGSQLRELDRGHQTVARQLRADLAPVKPRLRAAVGSQLRELAKTRAGAHDEWNRLGTRMQGLRRATVAPAPPPAPPIPAYVGEPVTGEAEVAPELAALGDRVFQYLAHHPQGTRLVELEQEFGVGRFVMSRVVQQLIDQGQAEKRDLLYFAV